MFYAIFEQETGRLVSGCTEIQPSLPEGLSALVLRDAPQKNEMWDEKKLKYVRRPAKIVKDKAVVIAEKLAELPLEASQQLQLRVFIEGLLKKDDITDERSF